MLSQQSRRASYREALLTWELCGRWGAGIEGPRGLVKISRSANQWFNHSCCVASVCDRSERGRGLPWKWAEAVEKHQQSSIGREREERQTQNQGHITGPHISRRQMRRFGQKPQQLSLPLFPSASSIISSKEPNRDFSKHAQFLRFQKRQATKATISPPLFV